MFVVAYSANKRDESPFLDMKTLMLPDKVNNNSDWNPIFKRNCNKLAVIGENWHSLATIRGSLHDVSNTTSSNINEIQVCGQRCPIHEIRNVCKMGNKTVVDLVVAIDPTGIKKIDTTESGSTCWECDISFPVGFTPLCYITKNSKFQYLGVIFHEMGIMAVDITPVSYTLLWDIPEACSVIINSKKIASKQLHKIEVLNAIPDSKFKIKVCSRTSDKFAQVNVQTPKITEVTMMDFYRSRRRKNDVYDLSGVKHDTVKYLRSNNILGSGHKVNVTPTSSKQNILTSVVISGETVPLSIGSSFYVIPDFKSESEQFICLEDEQKMTSHVIEFDKSESYVKYMDKVYPHGSTFQVNSQLVSVVSGSIILVVTEDTDPLLFPGGDAYASQILSAGDLVVRDLVMRSSSQVVEKVSGDTTYGKNSFFVYDPTAGTTKEVSRISHGLDDAGETGSVSIDLLYTDSLAVESIVNTFTTKPSSTTITSRDDVETISATFDSGGLSFDSDSGAIYFGAGKEFRIQYTDAIGLDPSMLKIESISGTDYLTRFLITDEAP